MITKNTKERLLELFEYSSAELLQMLADAGESYTDIAGATNLSRSQISLAINGKRTLGEEPYRAVLKAVLAHPKASKNL